MGPFCENSIQTIFPNNDYLEMFHREMFSRGHKMLDMWLSEFES